MKIETTRFGLIDVREDEFIVMKDPLLGFERLKRFVLLQHEAKTPLWWLQSVDEAAVAFVVVNPLLVKPDYAPVFAAGDLEMLEVADNADMAVLCIVTIRREPFRVTANLRAPILINSLKRIGGQFVLEDSIYPIQYEVVDTATQKGDTPPVRLEPAIAAG